MTDQELADALQAAIWKAKRMADEALARACTQAETSALAAQAVPPIAHMLAALVSAHGYATQAANMMPDVTPQFGGK